MELLATLLGVGVNVPFHINGLAFFRHRIAIGGGSRLTGFAHHHIRAINVQAHFFSKLQLIVQSYFDTIALIASNDQGLDPLILNAIFHAAGIMMAFFLPRLGIDRGVGRSGQPFRLQAIY